MGTVEQMFKGSAQLKAVAWRLLAVMVTVLVLLAITNPSEERHRQAIRKHAEMEAPYQFSEGDLERGGFRYQNSYLFSTTRISDEVGTFGFLGLVLTTDRLRPNLVELRSTRGDQP